MASEKWPPRDFYTLPNLIAILQAEQPTLSEQEIYKRALCLRREHYRLKRSWHRSQAQWHRHTELSGLNYKDSTRHRES
jgi:hypothetical protein